MNRNNRTRQFLAILIALLISFSCVPFEAFAVSDAFSRADTACYTAMMERKPSVNVRGMGLTRGNVDAFLDEFQVNHPEIFYGSPMFYSYDGDEIISFTLFYDANVSLEAIAAYEAAVESIVSGVSSAWTDVQKVLYFHDYLITHCTYDERLYTGDMPNESYNAYGALVAQTAVCNGYALALVDLCTRVGIPCKLITSVPMNHAWNIVKVGGSWYHVDATWDDPTGCTIGTNSHDFFLLSDWEMAKRGSDSGELHFGWEAIESCTNTAYDNGAYWANSIGSVAFDEEGNAFYVRSDGTTKLTVDRRTYSDVPIFSLVKRSVNGTETVLKTETDYWPSWGSTSYWTSPYASLAKVGMNVYFNTPDRIIACSVSSGELAEFRVDTTNGYVYGLEERNGTLLCELSKAPDEKGILYRVPIETFLPKEAEKPPVTPVTPVTPPEDSEPLYVNPQENDLTAKNPVTVNVADFQVKLNGRTIDNTFASYPLIVYNEITYFPMTYYDCRFLGLTTGWESAETGLFIDITTERGAYTPTLQDTKNASSYKTALLVDYPITVNGTRIDNAKEQYPLLTFRQVTYFPMTWRFCVDEFGWAYSYTHEDGLAISAN